MKLRTALFITSITTLINIPILTLSQVKPSYDSSPLEESINQNSSKVNSQWYIPYQRANNLLAGQVPAWQVITFERLPSFSSPGMWQSSHTLDDSTGYSLSLEWEKGQNISSVLTVGDFQSTFQLQLLSINSILVPLDIQSDSLTLSDFSLLENLTLDNLVEAIPDLSTKKINSVEPLADLLKTTKFSQTQILHKTFAQLLDEYPTLKMLKLSQINLSEYPLTSIPRLVSTPLKFFPGWQSLKLEDVPYLKKLPFSFFPNPPTNEGYFALVKSIDLMDEFPNVLSVSGGKKDGFEQNCLTFCEVISLGGSEFLSGRKWVGSQQKVRAGEGELAIAAGGLEPTGRHPYSDAFKVVLQPTDKTNAKINLYFRRENSELGKSPYFIGPVTLGNVRVGETVFLGKMESTAQSVESKLNSPTFNELEELNFLALQKAYEQVLGKFSLYTDSSPVLESSNGNFGILLGKYRFWSKSPVIRDRIYSKKGAGFLNKLESGKDTSFSEILTMFSPEQQDFLFASQQLELFDLAREQIDPETNKNFQGERAIERVAQMYLGGIGCAIDSDLVKEEASKIARIYYQITQK